MPSAKQNVLELRSLPQICKSICLPGEHPPVRLPTYPAVERTSVLAFNAAGNFQAGPTVGASYDARGMLFKHSVFPLWLDQVGPMAIPLGWWAEWLADSINGAGTVIIQSLPVGIGTGNGTTPSGSVISGFSSLSYYIPLGEYDNLPMLYTGSSNFGVFLKAQSAATPAVACTLDVLSVNLGGEMTRTNFVCNPVPGGWFFNGFLATGVGFIRPIGASQNTSTPAVITSVVIVATGADGPSGPTTQNMESNGTINVRPLSGSNVKPQILPFFNAPGLEVSTIPFSNTRTTAVAALFTNVTKALDKEGTVLAGRLNPCALNPFDLSNSSFATMLPCEKYFYGLENGFYTYAPLVSNAEEFSDDVFNRAAQNERYPWLHLENKGLVNCFILADPDGGTKLAINLDWHIEYRNSSVLWPVAISSVSLEVAHQAQLALLEAGFFFDNTSHVAILNALMQAMRFIAPSLKAGVRTVVRGIGNAMAGRPRKTKAKPRARKQKQKAKPMRRAPQKPKPTVLNVAVKPTTGKMKSGLDMYLKSRR